MSYLTDEQMNACGFRHLGRHVKISDKASIYDPERISIGDYSRIDDFCVVSGNLVIGSYCHITPMCLLAGGLPGIELADFCTLAYGVKIFAQSDDYSGQTLTNSLIPKKYKNEILQLVRLGRHVIVGAGSVIFPGADIAEGCAIGAMSLIRTSTKAWGMYAGIPARRIKERSRNLLELELQCRSELNPSSD